MLELDQVENTVAGQAQGRLASTVADDLAEDHRLGYTVAGAGADQHEQAPRLLADRKAPVSGVGN